MLKNKKTSWERPEDASPLEVRGVAFNTITRNEAQSIITELINKNIKLRERIKELKYFGSDLNKFVHFECTKQFTCINIDCLLLRFSHKRLRVIESKYPTENCKKSQKQVLGVLHQILMFVEQASKFFPGWKFDVYIVRSEPPYEHNVIQDLQEREIAVLSQDDFIKWLEFDMEVK